MLSLLLVIEYLKSDECDLINDLCVDTIIKTPLQDIKPLFQVRNINITIVQKESERLRADLKTLVSAGWGPRALSIKSAGDDYNCLKGKSSLLELSKDNLRKVVGLLTA